MHRPSSVRDVAALAAALAAVVLPLLILVAIVVFGVNIPYWDEWDYAHRIYLADRGLLTFADLWAPHGEHRIFLGRVIAVGLARLGGWDVVREQCFSLAVLVATQLVVWRIVRRTVAPAYAAVTLLFASLALYDVSQVENLAWGEQTLFFLPNLCAVVAIDALTGEAVTRARFALAIGAAVAGSLTFSSGLIVWPVGLVCIAAGAGRVRLGAVWVLAAAAVTTLVRWGIPPDTKLRHVSVLTHLPEYAQFIAAYLGAPLGRSSGLNAAAFAGLLTVAVVVAALVADRRSADPRAALRRSLPWYALALFPVLAALAAGEARLGLGVAQALESRYTTISALLDVAAVGLVAVHLPLRTEAARALTSFAAAVLALCVAFESAEGLRVWRSIAEQRRADVEALTAGTLVGSDIHWDPRRIPRLFEELRSVREGIFSR